MWIIAVLLVGFVLGYLVLYMQHEREQAPRRRERQQRLARSGRQVDQKLENPDWMPGHGGGAGGG